MEVRLREPGDISLCVEMLAEVHSLDGYPLQWPGNPHSWLTPRDLASAWVSVIDGELVGHIALVSSGAGQREKGLGRAGISRLFVSPTSRGRGVGAQLLETAIRESHLQGWELHLEVVEGRTAATQFYERHGWCLIDRGPASWTTVAGFRPILRHYARPGAAGRWRAAHPTTRLPAEP